MIRVVSVFIPLGVSRFSTAFPGDQFSLRTMICVSMVPHRDAMMLVMLTSVH